MRLRVLAAVGFVMLSAGCGDDDDDQSPVVTPFNFTIQNLPHLADNQYYGAWVAFAGEPGRLLHDDDIRESLGEFVVTETGQIESRSGGPASFSYSGIQDVNEAARILISVETHADTARGPVLLGGGIVGDNNEGRSTLTMEYHDAVVDPDSTSLDIAAGSFILATPTDGEGANENQGIWFNDPVGTPTLTLPRLLEGWTYHAHVFSKHAHSIGTFSATDEPDSDGPGEEGGPMPGFNAPGSDFLTNMYDLANGTTEAFIVIEPAGHSAKRGERALHDDSFPLRILEIAIPLGAAPRQSLTLGPRLAPWPTAEVTFPR